MLAPILATKLYIPPPWPDIVSVPRLVKRLNESLAPGRRLALISASAGFGKTTLVSEWITTLTPFESGVRVAWLSLDEGDRDLHRFLAYLVAAIQTIAPKIGQENPPRFNHLRRMAKRCLPACSMKLPPFRIISFSYWMTTT